MYNSIHYFSQDPKLVRQNWKLSRCRGMLKETFELQKTYFWVFLLRVHYQLLCLIHVCTIFSILFLPELSVLLWNLPWFYYGMEQVHYHIYQSHQQLLTLNSSEPLVCWPWHQQIFTVAGSTVAHQLKSRHAYGQSSVIFALRKLIEDAYLKSSSYATNLKPPLTNWNFGATSFISRMKHVRMLIFSRGIISTII